MMNNKIRNLAVTTATIVSVTALVALGATGASASTNPICSSGGARACVQIFGIGLNVVDVNGWGWNTTNIEIPSAHIEFYIAGNSQSPNAAGSKFNGWNCAVGYIKAHSNSGLCEYGPGGGLPEPTRNIYECTALWEDLGDSHILEGWACGFVHS